MPNPLAPVTSILERLSEEIKVLPAVGGATEDYLRPDQEEIEDALINRDVQEIMEFAENPSPSPSNLYVSTPPVPRSEKHLFRFFVDGSIRTYHLGTGIEEGRSFPIHLAQIGAALTRRTGNGTVKAIKMLDRILLLIPGPTGGKGLSDTVWARIRQDVGDGGPIQIVDITERDAISGEMREDTDLRNKAGAKARYEMHKLEIQLVEDSEGLRDEENWLILDGAVKLDQFIQSPYLIGVAKSFRRDPFFHFGARGRQRRRQRKDVTSVLAGLPHEHRTAAFSSHQGKVAFWYVRLREQRHLDYPLMGVVKVELPRPMQDPADAAQINVLSSALVAERNVTPYGVDRRWHCHLYPVFLTEQAIKNCFYTREVLLGALRWLRPSFS